MYFQQRTPMRFVRTVQRFDERQSIDMFSHIGKQIADPSPRLSILLEFPRALEQIACLGKLDPGFGNRERLTMQASKLGLVIEGVDMRGTSVHKHKNHSLDSGWKMTACNKSLLIPCT
jgi:hypothetical protein